MTNAAPAPVVDDDSRLRRESAEIQELLDAVRTLVSAPAWDRLEEVLRRVVQLYGTGLARVLACARDAGAEPGHFDASICDDELLASLLVIHGLHPLPIEQRVARAVDHAHHALGLREGAITFVGIVDGVAEVAASGQLGGGAMAERAAVAALHRVVEDAAPELEGVRVTGLPVARDPDLVQLRPRRQP
jgi:hypothetical protein